MKWRRCLPVVQLQTSRSHEKLPDFKRNTKPYDEVKETLLRDLKLCVDLEYGRTIHAKALESWNASYVHILTTLIFMYSKCASMLDAHRVFESIQNPDVVSWTALLQGYAENGKGEAALEWFTTMRLSGCKPDSLTYIAAVKACTSLGMNGGLERGREVHSAIGCCMDQYLMNTLIDMYAKCGNMTEARNVFDSMKKPDLISWNALLMGYVENGEERIALDLLSRMKGSGCSPDSWTYVAALKACTSLAVNGNEATRKDCLERGQNIHSESICHLDPYLRNALVDMYAKCGSMVDARLVFNSIRKPDVVSWTALFLGYGHNGEEYKALNLFSSMTRMSVLDPAIYVAVIKLCTSLAADGSKSRKAEVLERGREIHGKMNFCLDRSLLNMLISMYVKCESMIEARKVFESVKNPDIVSWNTLLLGYVENGEGILALELYSRMKACACIPDSTTYATLLKACISLKAVNYEGGHCLELGRKIHSEIGCHLNQYVQATLIDMYSKCGSISEAHKVFDGMHKPDLPSWTSLVLGYADNGEEHVALDFLFAMKASGVIPDSVAYIAALKACSGIGALALGRKFHAEIEEFTPQLVTCLVDFYAKCGSMLEARKVFDLHSKQRDVTTWTALLAGYSRFGDTNSAFQAFEAMQDDSLKPNAVTFVCLLWCCNHAGLVEKALEYFEAMASRYRVTPTLMHYNCMVDVLGRANQLNKAIEMIRKMPCNPDTITWTTLLGACRKWKNADIGKEAFQALEDINRKNASAYVLMAHV